METVQQTKNDPLRHNFIGMFSGLTMEFILGLSLATIVDYNPDATQQSMARNIILGLHILVAFMLLLGATIILVRTTKRPGRRWTLIGWTGIISVITALASGVLVVTGSWPEFFAFLMGLGFITALGTYTYALSYLRRQ